MARDKFKIKYGVSPDDSRRFVARIDRTAEFVHPVAPFPITVRDPADDVILATALIASADFLVTGDKDLLILAGDPRIAPLKIVTPRAFIEALDRLASP